MKKTSLKKLLLQTSQQVQLQLSQAKDAIQHPSSKGNFTENIWKNFFKNYLPERYKVASGFVTDSRNGFSHQIDILIFDRQYSPFMFNAEGDDLILPVESIYAAFEVKQDTSSENIEYAKNKIKSIRKLKSTSISIPHAGGKHSPKSVIPIIGGILATNTNNKVEKNIEKRLRGALGNYDDTNRLDIGCIANYGYFILKKEQERKGKEVGDYPDVYDFVASNHAVIKFLLKLISELQSRATVPMVDLEAYAKLIDDT